jgi:hypothetical protein
MCEKAARLTLVAKEKAEGVISLPADDLQAVDAMLQYFYRLDYVALCRPPSPQSGCSENEQLASVVVLGDGSDLVVILGI